MMANVYMCCKHYLFVELTINPQICHVEAI